MQAGLSQSAVAFQLRISVNLPAPSPPSLSLPLFSLSLPSVPLPRSEAAPLNQLGGLGERCKLPQRGPGRSRGRSRILLHCVLAKRIWASNLCLRHNLNVEVVQIGELIYTAF